MEVRNAELHRLIKVMNSLDEDGSGTIDYDEFYNFFLQCGYVLEYKTVQGIAGKMLEAAGEHGLKKSDDTASNLDGVDGVDDAADKL